MGLGDGFTGGWVICFWVWLLLVLFLSDGSVLYAITGGSRKIPTWSYLNFQCFFQGLPTQQKILDYNNPLG